MEKSKTDSPRKQKQLGPAPIASFEDTSSDELKFKVNGLEMGKIYLFKNSSFFFSVSATNENKAPLSDRKWSPIQKTSKLAIVTK